MDHVLLTPVTNGFGLDITLVATIYPDQNGPKFKPPDAVLFCTTVPL